MRQHQHAGVADRWIGADLPADLVAGLVGQHQIEEHDVGLVLEHRGEALRAGRRGHDLEPCAAQVELEQARDVALVFDDDHAALHRNVYSVVTRL
jgi:hypothetical protein